MTINTALRPESWDAFIGQHRMKAELETRIEAARRENRPLPHVLLAGPPGMGKTTFARMIADRLGDPFQSVIMPQRPAAFTNMVKQRPYGVLFLDELHRAPSSHQEDLLSMLEDGYLQTPSGPKIPVPCLTIIGATTEIRGIIKPLLDRFLVPSVSDYGDDELTRIILGQAKLAKVRMSYSTAQALARAACGTPRIARRLVLTARDLRASKEGRTPTAAEILELCNIDRDGMSAQHLEYLQAIHEAGRDGACGIKTIANYTRQDESVLVDLERLLIKRGYIKPTNRGRELTALGFQKVRATHDEQPAITPDMYRRAG